MGRIMKSARLKKIIGIIYFIVFVVFSSLLGALVTELQRFLLCCEFGFLGLGLRTFIYYGCWREDQNKLLNKKEVIDCIIAYFIYYPIGLVAVIGIIFIASLENLKNMNFNLFFLISIFLFSSLGFAINEAIDKFLFKINK